MLQLISPDLQIRTALYNGLNGIGIPTFVKRVPKNDQIPLNYVLISSQGKTATERSKCGFEWLCSVNLDIIYTSPTGYAAPRQIDEVEISVIEFIENGFNMPSFDLKSIEQISSVDLDIETPTQFIERRVLTYQFWVWQSTT